ncbi:MAG: GspMb/PilO family protein [Nitrospiraceae bacterium]|nr:GspMb/PilO family protein [Nitrospiraceae bacterium]
MKRLLKFRLQRREKKVLLIGGLFVTILITYHLFTWYGGMKMSIGDYAEAKRVYLLKQLNKISEKEAISRRLEATKGELRGLENGLIKGNKPPLVAAELQRLLKEMAKASGVDIKSERAMSPVDLEMYSAIPVEIGFTATTKKLKDMLLMIETSPLLLTIPEMEIRVASLNNPLEVYVTLTVRGLIRKGIKEQAERA